MTNNFQYRLINPTMANILSLVLSQRSFSTFPPSEAIIFVQLVWAEVVVGVYVWIVGRRLSQHIKGMQPIYLSAHLILCLFWIDTMNWLIISQILICSGEVSKVTVPKIDLEATHIKALSSGVTMEDLKSFSSKAEDRNSPDREL